jgi:hypothetical protein
MMDWKGFGRKRSVVDCSASHLLPDGYLHELHFDPEDGGSTFSTVTSQKIELFIVTAVRGRAIAQAVSRWLPTAAARVRSQVRSCGTCGGQSGTGAGFL